MRLSPPKHILALVTLAILGCAADDTAKDAEVMVDRSVPDALVRVDASEPDSDIPLMGSDCTSNYNDDCAANEVCSCANRNDSKCECMLGDRGTVPVGDECEDDNTVCETSICLDGICSQICEASDECTVLPYNFCEPVLGFCTTPPEE